MQHNVTALPVQVSSDPADAGPSLQPRPEEPTGVVSIATHGRRRREKPDPELNSDFEEICGLIATRFARRGAVESEICRFIGLLPDLKQVKDGALVREAKIVAGYLGRDDVDARTAARIIGGLADQLRPYSGVPALHIMYGVLCFLTVLLVSDIVLSYFWQTANWSLDEAARYPGFYIFNVSPWLIIAIGTAGGLGSIVSVLTRLQSFNILAGTDRRLLWIIGAMRPVIGIAFALFIFAVLQGQILPFNFPEGPQANFEYVALAFSERLARGVISTVEGRFLMSKPD
jgi:hypothetical protein